MEWSGDIAILPNPLTKPWFPSSNVSGTIIRGTLKAPNSQLVTPISTKLQRPDGRNSGQGSVRSRDMISPRPSPASGRNSRPRQIHALPEGFPQVTGAPSTRPRPSSGRLRGEATLARSPRQLTGSQEHSMQGSPDTLS